MFYHTPMKFYHLLFRGTAQCAASILLFVLLCVFPLSSLFAQPKRGIETEDLFRIKRVSAPALSPDGKFVAYVVGTVDKATNHTGTDIWLVPSAGGEAKPLIASPANESNPQWSPDGKVLSYLSVVSGETQISLYDMEKGTSKPLTTHYTGAQQQRFSPDGTMIAFITSVYPEFSDKPFFEAQRLTKSRDLMQASNTMKGVVFERLLYRHWDSWTDFKRMHLIVMPVNAGVEATPRDLTPGDRDAVPNSSTFSAGDDFAWSPDGKELAYTATPLPQREEAWTTNHDIFTVNLASLERKQITTSPAADAYPRYSPDGKTIAFRAQSTPGFEADKWNISLFDRASGKITTLTKQWDFSADQIEWANNGKSIIVEVQEQGEALIYAVPLDATKPAMKLLTSGAASSISVANNAMIAFAHSTLSRPAEIMTLKLVEKLADLKPAIQVTTVHTAFLNETMLGRVEKIYFQGAKVRNQAWMVRPVNFDSNRKYPVVVMIHGGPQSAWLNSWSNRWNMQVWAAQGYIVLAPNPTGSTGFGQAFVNAVSRDWGGAPYTDIMKCIDYATSTYKFIDTSKMAAAGASYGGYMVNWIATQTNRFKTLVTHCGVYNFNSMYGTTDEVWFEEWEHGKPWEKEDFAAQSPHIYAKDMATPMLVIQTARDYRVPLQEGMQLFTALQRRNIPSKLVYIPDEGHWVMKPQNSAFWHENIFMWLASYLKKP
jgi:dipeptidyl aminopeptidase/acylaminoacyl peptidase